MALALALMLYATPPAARALPPRSAAEQQRLTALADLLGQAHGLNRLCAGPADNLWRGRMDALLAAEAPPPDLRQRLVDAFNTGFNAGSTTFSACSPQSRSALSDTLRRAGEEAHALGAAAAPPPP